MLNLNNRLGLLNCYDLLKVVPDKYNGILLVRCLCFTEGCCVVHHVAEWDMNRILLNSEYVSVLQ